MVHVGYYPIMEGFHVVKSRVVKWLEHCSKMYMYSELTL